MPQPFVVRPREFVDVDAPIPRRERHPVFAPLVPFIDDPAVTDLFVNGDEGLFVDRGDGPRSAPSWHATEAETRELAVALIGAGGRHLDDASPCVDVRLDDGIRVHAVLPPVSATGTSISVRVPRVIEPDLDTLVRAGLTDDAGAVTLRRLVADRVNVLITGAAGTGNTTWHK